MRPSALGYRDYRRVALLNLRVAYGAGLLFCPDWMIRRAGGRPTAGLRLVARILGMRHLVQSALQCRSASPRSAGWGAGIDALHAGSMVAAAALDSRHARVALTDAVVETVFAAMGAIVGLGRPTGS